MARRSQRPKTGSTILVVDDDEGILASVRTLLEREGHEVQTAASGAEALEVLRHTDVHLLLVDYFMPRMTGAQLIQEIRGFDPIVQIVLQTGYSGEKPPREMLADLDIQGYHDKGRGPSELMVWVDVALKAHRRLRELKERERLQAELVANVSHEFRTPLNIIGGYTELLSGGEFGPLGDDASTVLARVQEACRNLSELVGDFLRYARVEARVEEVGEARLETVELAAEMERFASVLLDQGKLVRLSVDTSGAPSTIHTDGVKLRTILRNLLTNAAKFTEKGGIEVRFTENDTGGLSISVADTGPGIPADATESIFEPFRQLDGSSTRSHGGVGLGLALSRKLARLIGADLVVESVLGEGSTFVLTLPPESPSRDAPAASMEATPGA